jgi:hypothetical protein
MYACVSSYTDADSAFAILPELDYDTLALSATTLKFYAYSSSTGSSYNQHLAVGVITDQDMSTFQLVENVAITGLYAQYEVSFAGYNGDGNRVVLLAAVDPASTAYTSYCSVYVDDLEVIETPACTKPLSVSILSVVGDTVNFAWEAGGSETQWQYVCVLTGTTPDWTNAVLTDSTSATITGLSANSSYEIHVRSHCSATESSDDRIVSFRTACGLISALPWSEDFETYQGSEVGSTTGVVPNCWDSYSIGTSVTPHVIEGGTYAYTHSGTKALTFYGNGSCYAVLPEFAAPLNTLKITFWYRSESASYGELTLGYVVGTDTVVHPIQYFEPNTTMSRYEVVLDTVPAAASRLVFRWVKTGTWYSCCIDDVSVGTYDVNCMGVDNLRVKDVSLTGGTLAWKYIGGRQDADVQIATDAGFTELIDSARVVGDSLYYLTGMQASSTYYARVRQFCGDDNYSEWISLSFTTSYGVPFLPEFTSSASLSDWSRSNTSADQVFAGIEMAPTTSGWSYLAGNDVISTGHITGNIYGTGFHYWLITPSLDLTPNVGDGLMLKFDAALDDYSSSHTAGQPDLTGVDDRFLVAVSIDNGVTWNPADVTEWNNVDGNPNVYNDVPMYGTTYRINMTDYAGHHIKIGFYGESTVSNADNDFHFGNIRLEVVESTTRYCDTICEGYSFNDHGFIVSYEDLHVGTNVVSRYEETPEGESLTIQTIVVVPSSVNIIPVELCEGEHYNGYGFDFTVTKSENIRRRFDGGNMYGCDSTVILQVTMLPTSHTELHIGCNENSYTWHGKTYYQSTIVSDTTTSVAGCDSITTLYLTFCNEVSYRYHNVFCAGSTYNDEFFENLTAPGVYTATVTDEIGCRTSAELTLHMVAYGSDFVDTVMVKDLPYVWAMIRSVLLLTRPDTFTTVRKTSVAVWLTWLSTLNRELTSTTSAQTTCKSLRTRLS